ncbi:hypothetical protein Pfra02_07210 [Pseudomonas fragi]|nr:hypothetical protein Pfra02_07210 [Pseudomonas fragi]
MLRQTLPGSGWGMGQSARKGVQQAGKAGSRVMPHILPGLGRAG